VRQIADAADPKSPDDVAELVAVLADPATSYWLRDAIVSASARDPFDAERDAMFLAALLTRRVDAIVARLFP